MGSPYDAEALASAARRVSQKDSGNLKRLKIRNGRGDAMWSLMYYISWSYYTKSNPVNSQEKRFCWPFRRTNFFSGCLWDEYQLSTGEIRVSQEIKTLFLIQNHEHDDVSIKSLQTDVFKFPEVWQFDVEGSDLQTPAWSFIQQYVSLSMTFVPCRYDMLVCTSECFLFVYKNI